MVIAKRLTKVFTRQQFRPFGLRRRQERISKCQAIRAVDAVDLKIPEGTVFGLIGPNGAGKTTLVKVLATLITPTSGIATVYGFDITTEARKVRAAIGLSVGGERSFYWRLSGWQNLEFFAALQGLAGREAERRIADLLVRLDLTDAKDVAFMKYSTGMKRKLDLARALLMDPPVLLLDEPTSSLDPFAAQTIRATIRDLKQKGKTILLVTHNMYEAEQLCDVFGIMNHGQLTTIGDMPTLRQIIQGRKIRIRLSTPNAPGMYALARHVDGGGRIRQNGLDIEIFSPSGKVVINQVLRTIVETGMDIETIQVDEPSLEDVFVELTRSSGCTSP
jgi:ABC-2 type transport system ATP-binding protein